MLAAEGYLAGDDAHRARQLEWALTLPEARAAMAARGGYGTTRLLPLVDWKKAVAAPEAAGRIQRPHRDPLLRFHAPRRFPCIHGPMAAADLALRFDAGALDAFARLAAGKVSPREPWGEPMERVRGGGARKGC